MAQGIHLSFADDQVVLAQELEDSKYMTRKLIDEYKKMGLRGQLN